MDYARFPVGDLLARPGAHLDVDLALPVALATDAVVIDGTATGTLRIDVASGALVVRGRVGVGASITCARCLGEMPIEVAADLTATFGDAEDEDSLPISAERRIDLATPVAEELAMAMPVAPLCRPDCRGLCATCGTDLNGDPCAGHEDLSSSPFAALESLFPPE
jgi:uncharacterized protein